jgi:hypothetical protein
MGGTAAAPADPGKLDSALCKGIFGNQQFVQVPAGTHRNGRLMFQYQDGISNQVFGSLFDRLSLQSQRLVIVHQAAITNI